MAGTVLRIEVAEGAEVKADDVLLYLESMKMEIPVAAPSDGRVASLLVGEGDFVQAGDPLLELS